ncbi:extracellular solute-binding protein [Streptomyces avermitilis]|uniref:extracellular solute-binding protein n=1 Tax=Streptomyces avermitilis TaxID=33903 RepID=UPI0037FC9AA2
MPLRRHRRRAVVAAVALAGTLIGCTATGAPINNGADGSTGTVRALFATDAGYTENDIDTMIRDFEKKNPRVIVKPTYVTYSALHDKIVTAAPTGAYDVVHMDVVWPAEFASTGIVDDVTNRVPKSWSNEMLGGALNSALVDGKWYGVPWEPSSKLLFYNSDMLKRVGASPSDLNSWSGLLTVAKKLKRADIVRYPLSWSWSQSEALVCDFTQLLGSFGGQFDADEASLGVNSKASLATLRWMKSTIDEGLTDPASLSYVEDDVNKALSSQNAAIGLNWNSTFSALTDASQSSIAKSVGVLPTPVGTASTRMSVNGSMSLAVTRSSQKKAAAWKFIEFVTSRSVQQRFADDSPPNWKASYSDPSVVKTNPSLIKASASAYDSMISRPQIAGYNAVSRILQVQLQKALLGQKSPKSALDDAAAQIEKL